MKKLIYVFSVLLLASSLFSCSKPAAVPSQEGKQEQDPPKQNTLNSISVSPAQVTLEVAATQKLTVTVDPENYPKDGITWSSSNTAVATVSYGTITAVAAGTAVIKAVLEGKEASCTVTVNEKQQGGGSSDEWDGVTFVDRTAEWGAEFVDKGGWWAFQITSCTSKYHLLKYAQEGDDWFMPSDICHDPVSIQRAYQFFCVDVDYEEYLVGALKQELPDFEELVWPTGNGYAHGYAFGFNDKKQFTGEYAYLRSAEAF